MQDTSANTDNLQIVFHNDDETPWEFVVELVRSVFGHSEANAKTFTTMVAQEGKAVCGDYPAAVANAMLATAQQRINDAGHELCAKVGDGMNG